MRPFLFEIGPVKIPSYGFMLAVAFLVDYYLLHHDLKRRGKNPDLAGDVVFWAAIGGIVGSKIYYMAENYQHFMADPLGMIFSGSGLVFYGGLMGGMLAVTLLVRRRKESWLEFADVAAPLLILGYAIGRIGCFLVGDDYGIPTNLPWGVSFQNGTPPTTFNIFKTYYPWINLEGFQSGIVTVHPTQVYETLAGLFIFAILWKLRTKTKPDGMLFSIYLILAGTERFLIEFIRTNQKYVLGLTGAQIISLVMIVIASYLIFRLRSQASNEPTVQAGA